MVRETVLRPDDFVYPMFVVEGRNVRNPIGSMPGISQLSIDNAIEEARQAFKLGVPSVILFGIPDHKDAAGTDAYARDGIVHRVLPGNYMGQNEGRIISIEPSRINLIEIVPDGLGGFVERPATLQLAE